MKKSLMFSAKISKHYPIKGRKPSETVRVRDYRHIEYRNSQPPAKLNGPEIKECIKCFRENVDRPKNDQPFQIYRKTGSTSSRSFKVT